MTQLLYIQFQPWRQLVIWNMEYGMFENQEFEANKAIHLFYLKKRRSRPMHILLGCLDRVYRVRNLPYSLQHDEIDRCVP